MLFFDRPFPGGARREGAEEAGSGEATCPGPSLYCLPNQLRAIMPHVVAASTTCRGQPPPRPASPWVPG